MFDEASKVAIFSLTHMYFNMNT